MSSKDHASQNLLARIRRKYQTTTETLTFGDVTIDFTRVADPDVVLDEIIRGNDPPHLPYWAELWESAVGIARQLSEMPMPCDARVLDLGCGMGLAGAVAAARGAQVILADFESSALLFARLNCLRFSSRIRTRRLNWQVDRLDERFDLILGADILYERQQWEFLDRFWKQHLSDNGLVMLGEPGRQSGELFVPWIGGRGWNLAESSQPAGDGHRPIRIFHLTRQPAAGVT